MPQPNPQKIFFGELFWSAVSAVCTFRINRDLRRFHFAKRSRLEASTIQNGRDKQGIVMRRRVKCGRSDRIYWLQQVLRHGVAVVASRSEIIEDRATNIATARPE